MEKDILDVQLIQGPRAHSGRRYEKTNRSHLGNMGESVIVIGAIYLSIPLGNQTRVLRRFTRPSEPILIA